VEANVATVARTGTDSSGRAAGRPAAGVGAPSPPRNGDDCSWWARSSGAGCAPWNVARRTAGRSAGRTPSGEWRAPGEYATSTICGKPALGNSARGGTRETDP